MKKKTKQRRHARPKQGYLLELYQKKQRCKQISKTSKAINLVVVSATFALVTSTGKEAQTTQKMMIIDWVPYTYYLTQFQKNKTIIGALINSGSKINIMTLAYAFKQSLKMQKTDVPTLKIDG